MATVAAVVVSAAAVVVAAAAALWGRARVDSLTYIPYIFFSCGSLFGIFLAFFSRLALKV